MEIIDFTDSIYDAQQGSQSAIKFIYDNTIQLFCNEANVFLRDKDEADKAIRDAYIFIFDHLGSLEDPSKFLLWANEVCKNTCIARLKEAGAFNERIPAEAANLGEILPSADYDNQINPHASMLSSHIQACLEAILDSLPDNQRACAILWGEGYPIRSIARKLELSKVAVNYTLAYALGNITNSVATLGENGLPLYSMDPIPFFLWLLISYYQLYEPQETFGMESSFANILRVLMPEEASVFEAEYSQTEVRETDGRVKHITDFASISAAPAKESAQTQAPVFGSQELDVSDFIQQTDSSGDFSDADSIFDSVAGTVISDGEPPLEVPPMDIYPAHTSEMPPRSDTGETPDFSTIEDSTDSSTDGSAAQGDKAGAQEESDEHQMAANAAAGAGDSDTTDTDAAISGAAAGAGIAGAAADTAAGNAEAAAGAGASDTTAAAGALAGADVTGTSGQAEGTTETGRKTGTSGEETKKKRTGLVILLIVIVVIICLVLAAFFLLSDEAKSKINQKLGTDLLPTSEAVEPETATEEETTTEEVTTEIGRAHV